MNKKQLLQQNESLMAGLNEKEQELQALHIRLQETAQQAVDCRAQLEQVKVRLQALLKENQALFEENQALRESKAAPAENPEADSGAAEGPAVELTDVLPEDDQAAAEETAEDLVEAAVEDPVNDLADDLVEEAAEECPESPVLAPPAETETEGFRIPDFGQHDTDFEQFFQEEADFPAEDAPVAEETAGLQGPDVPPAENAGEETDEGPEEQPVEEVEIPAESQPEVDTCPAPDPTDEIDIETETQAALEQQAVPQDDCPPAEQAAPDPAPAPLSAAEQQELQNYCARLIGRIALAAARVIAHCPESNGDTAANLKGLALERSEAFKAQALACLAEKGPKERVQSQLELLATDTENYLNRLAD